MTGRPNPEADVPFVDLPAQVAETRAEALAAIGAVLDRAAFILGGEVERFEGEFAAFCGTAEAVGVASGCDALLAALKACGIGPGDEVITAANTFVATVLAIRAAGARPVLADCRPDTLTLDPDAVRHALTPRTRALVPVHLYGHPADMERLLPLAREHGLRVIEDAAQAHGAAAGGRPCGSFGDAGCFSFYPAKNLGAWGDGGAVTTDRPEIAEAVRRYRNYGQRAKNVHEAAGWNCRLDTLQAAVLRVNLRRLPDWNEARRRHAAAYRDALRDLPLRLPGERPGHRHAYHLFVVRTPRRDELMRHLAGQGIGCGLHYPTPVHLQGAFRDLGHGPGSFPVAEQAAREVLSLPLYPQLDADRHARVVAAVRSFFGAE